MVMRQIHVCQSRNCFFIQKIWGRKGEEEHHWNIKFQSNQKLLKEHLDFQWEKRPAEEKSKENTREKRFVNVENCCNSKKDKEEPTSNSIFFMSSNQIYSNDIWRTSGSLLSLSSSPSPIFSLSLSLLFLFWYFLLKSFLENDFFCQRWESLQLWVNATLFVCMSHVYDNISARMVFIAYSLYMFYYHFYPLFAFSHLIEHSWECSTLKTQCFKVCVGSVGASVK